MSTYIVHVPVVVNVEVEIEVYAEKPIAVDILRLAIRKMEYRRLGNCVKAYDSVIGYSSDFVTIEKMENGKRKYFDDELIDKQVVPSEFLPHKYIVYEAPE